jgi:membrane-bound serine protease (ClpP class)
MISSVRKWRMVTCAPSLLLLLVLALFIPSRCDASGITVATVDGDITPVTADYLKKSLHAAAQRGDRLFLIELDTPGGLESSMREIIKEMLASTVPVAVFVAPSGARAGSAGAIITLAADIAAMAPGTNIGAAHPVSFGAVPDKVMEQKILNDSAAYAEGVATRRGRNGAVAVKMVRESISLAADKALSERVIDLIAADRADLLRRLEGRVVSRGGKDIPLNLAGAEVTVRPMSSVQNIMEVVSDPDIAYILMIIGVLGLMVELANPGVILPGVVGGVSLVLALFGFETLPVNFAGVLLILLAIVFLIAEIKIVSHGMLTVAGVVSLVFGSLMLYDDSDPALRVSWSVIAVAACSMVGFSLFAVSRAVRAHRAQPTTGREGLIGETGRAVTDLAPEGKVLVRGEFWNALSEEPVASGKPVTVIMVDGMVLRVRRENRSQ